MSEERDIIFALRELLPLVENLVDEHHVSLNPPAIFMLGAGVSVPELIVPQIRRTVVRCCTYGDFKVRETISKIVDPVHPDRNFYFTSDHVKSGQFVDFLRQFETLIDRKDTGALESFLDSALKDTEECAFVHEIIRKNHEYRTSLGLERSMLHEFAENVSNICMTKISSVREWCKRVGSDDVPKLACTANAVVCEMSRDNLVALVVTTNWDCFFEEHVFQESAESNVVLVLETKHIQEDELLSALDLRTVDRKVHLVKPHGTVEHDRMECYKRLRAEGIQFPTEFVFFSSVNARTDYLSSKEKILALTQHLSNLLKESGNPVIIVGYRGKDDHHILHLLESLHPIRSSFVVVNPRISDEDLLEIFDAKRARLVLRVPATLGLLLVYAYLLHYGKDHKLLYVARKLRRMCPHLLRQSRIEVRAEIDRVRRIRGDIGYHGIPPSHVEQFWPLAVILSRWTR
jgi:hypothetical protein